VVAHTEADDRSAGMGADLDPVAELGLEWGTVRKRQIAIVVACVTLVALVIAVGVTVELGSPSPAVLIGRARPSPSAGPVRDTDSPAPTITAQPSPLLGPLHVTGDPEALPGFLLISDRGNSRIIEIDGRGDINWQFPPPGYQGPIPFDQNDDAFYSPDHQQVTTNEEFEHTIQVIDRHTNQVTWYYGTPYRAGSGPNFLNGPDDAYMLPDGRVMTADIKNCRVLFISPSQSTSQIGHTGTCRHNPGQGYFASPNGDAPSPDYQHVVITEIGGSWVDVFTLPDLRLEYSFKSPAQYPSDAIMQDDGTFLLTDYISSGKVYRVDGNGALLWKYDTGLDHPSIAIGLPNGNVAIADDLGQRVIIVDPSTNTIVWQYGVKNSPGATAGHLYIPDGLDFRASAPIRSRPLPGSF
jgi:outer membrane protein assembly factor BamB